MLEQRGLIQIKWLEYGNDIEKITYCLKHAGRPDSEMGADSGRKADALQME